MNKIKYSFIVLLTTLAIISCSKDKDEDVVVVPPRPYGEQYAVDIVDIEEYLKTNYITVDADYNITVAKITDPATQKSIKSYEGNTDFPKLLFRTVALDEIEYKLYYLVVREGVGESPMNVDAVWTAYSGSYLTSVTTDGVYTQTSTPFETVEYPSGFIPMYDVSGGVINGVIRGWKEVFPQFKSGTYVSNADGTVTYDNYGVGMMFIPSGLAYYASGNSSIPAYAPLVFSFKLFEIDRLDHDFVVSGSNIVPSPDGLLSIYEDIDGDGYVWTSSELNEGVVNPDDTDGDGLPDFLDVDDDGDKYLTKYEITNPLTGLVYPFDEIPTCASGKKNYLDASCFPE